MASVRLVSFIFLYFGLYIAKADDCVTYNFEDDINSHFVSDTGVCEGANMAAWSVGSYSALELERPHENSVSFISPASALSCGSTFVFAMTAGGTVEINVYMESNFITDQISVVIMQVVPDGTDAVIGSLIRSPSDAAFTNGWYTLSTVVAGIGNFDGYISFMGMQSVNSVVLVDSFRYIPPELDQELCIIYGDSTVVPATTLPTIGPTDETTISNVETTTSSITEAISVTTTDIEDTTPQQIDETECVTINFESDFDVNFSTDNYLCTGFLPWQLDNYTSINIESPDPRSNVFMAPHEYTSCISSFIFKMEPDGIVEATVFMDPVQTLDHIIIIAQRLTGNDYDTVAGFVKYHPLNEIFVPGWNVIRFTLLDLTSFDGYLIFIGSAESSSTVLVDSVRYIPPRTSSEDASCNVY